MKNSFFIIFLIGTMLLLTGCSKSHLSDPPEDGLSIATTFYPLYDATRMVTGNHAHVFSLIPPASASHGYRPTPRNVIDFSKADVFVTTGLEFEKLEEDILDNAEDGIFVINAAEGIELLDVGHDSDEEERGDERDDDHEAEPDEDEEDHPEYSGIDPHFWLSPENMKRIVTNVKEGLMEFDPENAELYEQNAKQSISQLEALDNEFRTELASCDKNVVLVSHNAFSYLSRDYGFETFSVSGVSPEIEPNPMQLKELVDKADEHGLKYVFYEDFSDPRVSNSIAREIGAETLKLNTLEGTKTEGDTYVSLMRENIANLKIAMECQ